MVLFVLKALFSVAFLYCGILCVNVLALFLDNQVKISSGQVGYKNYETLVIKAFAKTHKQIKQLGNFAKKGSEYLVAYHAKKLSQQQLGTEVNGIVSEINHNFQQVFERIKMTNYAWFDGNYLYIPISREVEGQVLREVESYLLGVGHKYMTSTWGIDTVECRNINRIGWCILAQFTEGNIARFNRLARSQEVARPNEFQDDDGIF